MQKYRDRIAVIPEGIKTLKGKGLHTQPKRNAYKINQYGQYGGLMIDILKLMRQLRLVETKDDQKVLDKKVDFDTIDLLKNSLVNFKASFGRLSTRLASD